MRQEVARGVAQNYGKYYEGAQLHGQFSRVDSQVEAVHSSARSISSVAETLGAVEYESRLSAAVELVLMYVDTLKRKWEKEHRELEETKRILKESGVNVAHCLEAFRERNRPRVDSGSSASPTAKRRASFQLLLCAASLSSTQRPPRRHPCDLDSRRQLWPKSPRRKTTTARRRYRHRPHPRWRRRRRWLNQGHTYDLR